MSNFDTSGSLVDLNEERDTQLDIWSSFDAMANKHRANTKIGHINANSIADFQFFEIRSWLMSGWFDILLITETKIDATFSNSQFNVEGFRMYRVDRNAHGGGLMIFIRNDICFPFVTRFNVDMSSFRTESMLLKVKINKSWSGIVGIYRPPKTPADWESYKRARNKAVFLLRGAKSEFFKTTFENNKNNPKGIWKTIKSLIGANKQQSINHLRIKEKDLGNNEEMTEAFNVHFSTVADKLRKLLPDVPFDTSKLSNFVRSRKDESAAFSIPPIAEADVVGYLLKIDSNKSTGGDGVSSRMLKLAAPIIAPSITKLINLSFS